ncbi:MULTISPECIES: hypothetical protein [Streptomyces]|uniref:hypothetical protein n=1 Tax=Streptomyces TaxID=1883 RepID=UPI00164741DC|nr:MULTISPECIES: hypothetical protein [Streptomyces]MBT3074746.1 hypothetical protein [Streptomyces sp. COG21]MBT3081798.1 hypothetical protein [Streptomyces sp. COG20]MBT3090680.1 hypothetical protein [Streptomyces sp. CYG21]MBT3098062.1 hypothetical protein [Streptomyces sp. CBG30]MBT3105727.1 hypothetical protein [Streptomyces sp. COG19]
MAPVPGAAEAGEVAVAAVQERVVAPGREAAEVAAVRVSEEAGAAAEEGVAGAPAW